MFRMLSLVAIAGAFLLNGLQPTSGADHVISVSPYSYAAIAYNPETGKYGYAYNYRSRAGAESEALQRCPGEDSRIVCWVNRGFCVLALGNDQSCYGIGYTFDDDASLREAERMALDDCDKRTSNSRTVVAISSDGQYQFESTPAPVPQTD